MNRIIYKGEYIKYRVRRSKKRKKTVAVRVEHDAAVVVFSPEFLSDRWIKDFVSKKASWIVKKRREASSRIIVPAEYKYIPGELFSYLGTEYPLEVVYTASGRGGCRLTKSGFLVEIRKGTEATDSPGMVKKRLIEWFKKEAERIINERLEIFIPAIGKRPNRVVIKNQQKRWGSCSWSGVIRFNWKVVMLQADLIDYIVVHELSHLEHLNHSKDFWKKVAGIIPDFEERKKMLKAEKNFLFLDGFRN